MELSKVGGLTWSGDGEVRDPKQSSLFMEDAAELKLTNSVSDLLQITRSRDSRQFVETQASKMKDSLIQSQSTGTLKKSGSLKPVVRRKPFNNLHERPPDRNEIDGFDRSIVEQAQLIMMSDSLGDPDSIEKGTMYHPQSTGVRIVKEKLIKAFGLNNEQFEAMPWMNDLMKCECLRELCEDSAGQLADMVSISSGGLGQVMRRVKSVYEQTIDQMKIGWVTLFRAFEKDENTIVDMTQRIHKLEGSLQTQEQDVSDKLEYKLLDLKKFYEDQRAEDLERLRATEFQLEQTQQTLTSLNGIFKAMQSDSASVNTNDLIVKSERLGKEVDRLQAQNAVMNQIKLQLETATTQLDSTSRRVRIQDVEIDGIRKQLAKRDETISKLMERDALRQAEIDQLQKTAALMAERENEEDFEEPPTTVLCVKCKKGLDDISNIKAAVTGMKLSDRLQCQSYRVLLPNLVMGRRPHRSTPWVRYCMRAIMLQKMNEEVVRVDFRGQSVRFPEFCYAFFEPIEYAVVKQGRKKDSATSELSAAELQLKVDEDRWGFYYGVKVLAKDNPEATLFWNLLDEAQGDDGLSFVFYCLSVVMSIGGANLWAQLAGVMGPRSNIYSADDFADGDEPSLRLVPEVIWVHIKTAKDAAKRIFIRALEDQIKGAIESIEAMKEVPTGEVDGEVSDPDAKYVEATHINLFAWLRLMLARFQEERSQRAAAVRLMFEAASVGALNPDGEQLVVSTTDHTEFPQFAAIVRTLAPGIAISEVASIFTYCFEQGDKKVTSDTFLRAADHLCLFSKWMKLPPLPLLNPDEPHLEAKEGNEEKKKEEEDSEEAETTTEVEPEGLVGPKDESMDFNPSKVIEKTNLAFETKMRASIGSLVHIRLARMMPQLEHLMHSLPESWRRIVGEGINAVQQALREGMLRNLKKDNAYGMEEERAKPRWGWDIDGIQPFVHYQRLLSTAVSIQSFNQSPVLPSSLIRIAKIPANGVTLKDSHLDYKSAEKLLNGLEESLLLMNRGPSHVQRQLTTKFNAVVRAKDTAVAKRVQALYRSLLKFDGLCIPRSVRFYMRPGYLRGCRFQGDEGPKIRNRAVNNEPYVAMSYIGEIFTFKLNYDSKARCMGQAPIPLSHAVASYFFTLWGSLEIAERFLQDFFNCCKVYEMSSPRIRLFLTFLGASDSMLKNESVLAKELRCEFAVTKYIEFILCLHRTTGKSDGPVRQFFTSNGKGFQPYGDQKDAWFETRAQVDEAVIMWMNRTGGRQLFGRGGLGNILIDNISLLAEIDEGRVDVDECIWICLTGWARVQHQAFITMGEKTARFGRKATVDGTPPIAIGVGKKILSLTELNSLVNSGHSGNKSEIFSDKQYAAAKYIDTLAPKSLNQSSGVKKAFGLNREDVSALESCSIWDMVTQHHDFDGSNLHSGASKGVHPCISFAIVRNAFFGYSDSVEAFAQNIEKYKENGGTSGHDVESKLESVKLLLLRTNEIYSGIKESVGRKFDTDDLTDLMDLESKLDMAKVDELQSNVFTIFSHVDELFRACYGKIAYPTDMWAKGRKLPLEKSAVFTMSLR
jgi:hypothetical protein